MIDDYIFFKNLPKLDLHGFDSNSAVMYSKEFINDNYKLNNKLIVIIHGKGGYILKNKVHKMLKSNKLVKNYKLDIYNDGATIVEII